MKKTLLSLLLATTTLLNSNAQSWYSYTTSSSLQREAMDLEIVNTTKIFFGMNEGNQFVANARIKKFTDLTPYSLNYNTVGSSKYTGPNVTGSFPNAGVRGISFPTVNNGWGVWNDQTTNTVNIVHSSDAGETWAVQSSQTGSGRDIKFFDNNNGVVLLQNSVLKTTDGGATWTTHVVTGAEELNKFYFVDNTTGWAVGNKDYLSNNVGQIFKTTDGGNTWTLQFTSTIAYSDLTRVFMHNATTGWAVGKLGTILKTSDGGMTWTAQTSTHTGEYKGVYFVDANKGWAVGTSNAVAETLDGGLTWTVNQVSNGVAGTFVDIDFIGNTGIILDIYGGTLKYCPSITNTISISECYDPNGYLWGNQFIYETGVYTYTYQTANYCDSVVTANITILQAGVITEDVTYCGTMYFTSNGNGYNASGQYPIENIPGGAVNGCDSVRVLNLTLYPPLSANLNSLSWNGVTLTPSNPITLTTGETLQWINCVTGEAIVGETEASFTPTQSGQYALVLNNGNCSDTSNCKDVCLASLTNNGTTLTVVTDLVGATFGWIDCSSEELIAGEVSQNFTPTSSGSYLAFVNNSDETCGVQTACEEFTFGGGPVGLKEKSNETFTISPNPASEKVTISNLSIGSTLQLTDLTGKVILEKIITSEIEIVTVNELNNGIYFIQLMNNSTKSTSKKLVINK